MPKLNNMTNSMISNPLVVVIVLLFIILIALGIIRVILPNFSAGLGIKAHVGTIKGNINLETYDNQSGPEFVMFKADWCGHCKRTMPEFEKLESENIQGCKITKIDSDENPEIIKSSKVQGFPTLRFYPNGLNNLSNYHEYNGERNVEGFKTFLNRVMNN